MKAAPILLSAAVALALAACGNNDTQNNDSLITGTNAGDDAADNTVPRTGAATDPMNTGSDAVGLAAGDQAGTASAGDRTALMMVAEVDRHEITAAEDALAKGVEGEVRDYAQTLIDDHTRNLETTERLMDRAGSGGAAGTGMGPGTGSATATGTGTGTAAGGRTAAADQDMPGVADMKQKHEAEREHLSQLEGEEFTTAWIEAMVAGHEAALAMLDDELIPGASDPEVTSHLQNTRSAIASHLETARSLQSNR